MNWMKLTGKLLILTGLVIFAIQAPQGYFSNDLDSIMSAGAIMIMFGFTGGVAYGIGCRLEKEAKK